MRIIGTTTLSNAESMILDFLQGHKGDEYTAEQLQVETGIRSTAIPRICEGLNVKGHPVCMKSGRYFVPTNPWWSFAIAGGIIFFIVWMMFQPLF